MTADPATGIDEPVHLEPYNPSWQTSFGAERERLCTLLKILPGDVEHIGSTAVPGLAAKPIIDIQIGVETLNDIEDLLKGLQSLGYRYLGEAGVPERHYLRRRGLQNFNVHVVKKPGRHWNGNLALRDYLIAHPAESQRYQQAKRTGLESGNGMLLAYSTAKSEILSDLISRATEWKRTILTDRLILRPWKQSDLQPFAEQNADPRVMEFFPACLTREESDQAVERYQRHIDDHGFAFFAAEMRANGNFIGIIGLAHETFQAHFTPCVEIGWRLAAAHWNQGFATEGARAIVRYAFDDLHLSNLVALTVPLNVRSRRVMEKLGMTRDPADDFDHPGLPLGHPIRRHVLYRLTK